MAVRRVHVDDPDDPKMSFTGILNKIAHQPSSYSKRHQYKFGKILGSGTYGIVREADSMKANGKFAVKIILKKNVKGHEQMVYDELDLLQRLDHPHTIKFVDWFESKDKFYIVTDLATGGELFDRICELGKFTEADARNNMREILSAVDYLHDHDIVHRDLKPENLLFVTPSPTSSLVLADFGIAKMLETKDELLLSMAGSFGYAAPEIMQRKGHGKPADIWSLGVITYTILCGYTPFRSETIDDLIAEMNRDSIVFHSRYWGDVSEEAKSFIRRLLSLNPAARPTSKQALQDPWIKGDFARNTDLLPNVREGFNARKKFLGAIEAVRLANRIKHLGEDEDDEEQCTEGEKTPSLSSTIPTTAPNGELTPPQTSQRRKSGSGMSIFQEVVRAKLVQAKEDLTK